MGKREAQFVTLRQLREEVGNDACRLFYLMRSHDQPLDFDLELAKSRSNENPVYYIQYAHARVASVMKQLAGTADSSTMQRWRSDNLARLDSPHEQAVLRELARYREVLRRPRLRALRTRWCTTCVSSPTHSTPGTTPRPSSSTMQRCATLAWRSRWRCSR